MTDTQHYPPPWNLYGEGFIIPFLGNKSKLLENGFMTDAEKNAFKGGIGACMLVNYETSNVGSYYELLFIPGDFKFIDTKNTIAKSKTYKRITKIYVSSEVSIQEGRLNWGIPKEYADFKWIKEGNKTQITVATKEGIVFLEADFTKKYFHFPITTKLYPVSLLQTNDKNKLVNTKFIGKGKGMISFRGKWVANEKYFVNLETISKLDFSLAADEFNIIFPLPEYL